MSTFTDFVEGRILAQIDDTTGNRNFRTLMITLTEAFFDFATVIDNIYDAFDLDTAVGDQLDKIGSYVGLPRSGFSDSDYRRNINIQISIITSKLRRDPITGDLGNWNGTVNNILSIARTFIGPAVVDPIVLKNLPPYSFEIEIPGNLTLTEIHQLFQFIKKALYAGVLGYTVFLLGGANNLWAAATQTGMAIAANNSGSFFVDESSEFNVSSSNHDFALWAAEYKVSASCALGFSGPYNTINLFNTQSSPDTIDSTISYWNGNDWSKVTPVTSSAGTDLQLVFQDPTDWDTITYPPQPLADTLSGTYVVNDNSGSYQQLVTQFSSSVLPCKALLSFSPPSLTGSYGALNNYNYKFGGVQFNFEGGTLGVGGAVEFQYWNGSAWTALPNVVDNTNNFTAGLYNRQYVTWDIPDDWAKTTLDTGGSGYAVKWVCTTPYSTIPYFIQGQFFDVRDGSEALYWSRFLLSSGSAFTVTESYTHGNFGDVGAWEPGFIANEGLWAYGSGSALKVWQISTGTHEFWVEDLTNNFNNGTNAFYPYMSESVGNYTMYGSTAKFDGLDIKDILPGNSGSTSWQYLNTSSSWVALTGVVDNTDGYTTLGDQSVTWDMPSDWGTLIQNGKDTFDGITGQIFAVSGSGEFIEITTEFFNTSSCQLFSGTNGKEGNYLYIVDYDTTFQGVIFDFVDGVLGDGTVEWQYWNSSSWVPLSNVNDQTSDFTYGLFASQSVSWDIPSDWTAAQELVSSSIGYGVRAYITGTDYTTLPETTGSNYIYNRQNIEAEYYVRSYITATYSAIPSATNGLLDPPYGYWASGSVDGEGIWSLAVSTADNSVQIANDNT